MAVLIQLAFKGAVVFGKVCERLPNILTRKLYPVLTNFNKQSTPRRSFDCLSKEPKGYAKSARAPQKCPISFHAPLKLIVGKV